MCLSQRAVRRTCRSSRDRRSFARVAVALVMATVLVPAAALAQSTAAPAPPPRWSIQVAGEHSAVTDGSFETVWSSQIATVGFLDEAAGGWHASVERQTRGDLRDMVVTTGGYRRLGDWTIGGTVSASPDPSFWYRRAFDGELSRRIVGTVVASAAYRFMDFPAVSIHQLQPAITWYNPRGDLQARVYVTRNTTQQRTTFALLVRSTTRLNEHTTVVGAVAAGDRIFDIASLAYGTASSWTARGGLRLDLTRRNQIEIGGGYASERPAFTQRTIALSYRRAF
jgi:YaiO family outer membrane protein